MRCQSVDSHNSMKAYVARSRILTDKILFGRRFIRYHIVDGIVSEEVEWLERIKYKVAHVLIHVCIDDATVISINYSTAIHYLHRDTYRGVLNVNIACSVMSICLRSDGFQSECECFGIILMR